MLDEVVRFDTYLSKRSDGNHQGAISFHRSLPLTATDWERRTFPFASQRVPLLAPSFPSSGLPLASLVAKLTSARYLLLAAPCCSIRAPTGLVLSYLKDVTSAQLGVAQRPDCSITDAAPPAPGLVFLTSAARCGRRCRLSCLPREGTSTSHSCRICSSYRRSRRSVLHNGRQL